MSAGVSAGVAVRISAGVAVRIVVGICRKIFRVYRGP
jgi:hypothetical protein